MAPGGSGLARTYTPEAGFIGTDSFTFVANDGLVDSNVAQVSVSVTADSGGGSGRNHGTSSGGCGAGGLAGLLLGLGLMLRVGRPLIGSGASRTR